MKPRQPGKRSNDAEGAAGCQFRQSFLEDERHMAQAQPSHPHFGDFLLTLRANSILLSASGERIFIFPPHTTLTSSGEHLT